jgi:chromosome segregation ATPase
MNDLLVGLLSGVLLASGTFTLRGWRRKNRSKQPWLQQAEQQAQRQEALEAELQAEQGKNQALAQELLDQQRQLELQQQQLETAQARCEQLSQDLDKAWQEAEQILDSEQAEASQRQAQVRLLTAERDALGDRITQLEADLAAADQRLIQQARTLEEAEQRVKGDSIEPEQLTQAICQLLPNLTFLRDSLEVMIQEPPNRLEALLVTLRALSDGSLSQNHKQNGVNVVKVHATSDRWSEYHVPRASMMRVYFNKSKQSNQYQVLVAEKKDGKSQDKNHAWLKSQNVS